jgi:hypothetical protein
VKGPGIKQGLSLFLVSLEHKTPPLRGHLGGDLVTRRPSVCSYFIEMIVAGGRKKKGRTESPKYLRR